ncbi:hypothetical protein V2I01_40385 [Micromonospora sp. BRA006-A]|nr:hypothetical protein [Micromonospora sp. BRA006-A]
MTAADVRGADPGDGRISTPSAARAPACSAAAPVPPASPPLAADRDLTVPNWSEVVEHFREGLVVCDADGVVQHVSPVAERLIPEVTPGELLAAAGPAQLRGDGPAEFTHRGRRLRVRPVALSHRGRCWYVDDVTEIVSRADALLAERARSAFLAVVGEKLGNPLRTRTGPPPRWCAWPCRRRPTWRSWSSPPLRPGPLVAGGTRGRPAAGGGQRGAARHGAARGDRSRSGRHRAARAGLAGRTGRRRGLAARPGRLGRHRMVVPLPGREAPAGALLVARRADRWYGEADVDLVRAFAARAGAALTTAMLYRDQAEVADTLQASLLPVEPAAATGVQWHRVPAGAGRAAHRR